MLVLRNKRHSDLPSSRPRISLPIKSPSEAAKGSSRVAVGQQLRVSRVQRRSADAPTFVQTDAFLRPRYGQFSYEWFGRLGTRITRT